MGTFLYMCLSEPIFSILLDIYFGVKLLGPKVSLCSTFEELPNCVPQWQQHFIFPLAIHDTESVLLKAALCDQ